MTTLTLLRQCSCAGLKNRRDFTCGEAKASALCDSKTHSSSAASGMIISTCQECGRLKTIHAKGLCDACYHNVKYRNDVAYRERVKHRAALYYDSRDFGGLRTPVLERDGFRCTRCGSDFQLSVHHVNRRGRGSESPDNRMDNLVTLCRRCHLSEHRTECQAGRGFLAAFGWAAKYGLDGCRQCGRNDTRHAADGLCTACWTKRKYHTNSAYREQRKQYERSKYQNGN